MNFKEFINESRKLALDSAFYYVYLTNKTIEIEGKSDTHYNNKVKHDNTLEGICKACLELNTSKKYTTAAKPGENVEIPESIFGYLHAFNFDSNKTNNKFVAVYKDKVSYVLASKSGRVKNIKQYPYSSKQEMVGLVYDIIAINVTYQAPPKLSEPEPRYRCGEIPMYQRCGGC